MNGIKECTRAILGKLGYSHIRFIVEAYKADLNRQVKEWNTLTADLIQRLQPYYEAD